MSYLLDKKNKRKKLLNIGLLALVFVLLFLFRAGISSNLSRAAHFVFRPALVLGQKIGHQFSYLNIAFYSKQVLLNENENLKMKLGEQDLLMANYNTILDENLKLKESFSRKAVGEQMMLAAILSKPNHSIYDTLIIDVGADQGIQVGEKVFALGNIPIGRIAEVEKDSAKVVLYTNPGEKTQSVISGKDIFVDLMGRGGGDFEIILPKDLELPQYTEIVLPGMTPYLIGEVQTTISDPRDSLRKALVTSPVNIQELKFVEVAQ